MQKKKLYKDAHFSADVISEAIRSIRRVLQTEDLPRMSVELDDARWSHDDLNEFLADYRRSTKRSFSVELFKGSHSLSVSGWSDGTEVAIAAPSRAVIEELFTVFEKNYETSIILPPPAPVAPPKKPVIFTASSMAGPQRSSSR